MSEPLSKRIKAYVPVEGGEEPAERLSVDELFAWCLDAQALETEVFAAKCEASEARVAADMMNEKMIAFQSESVVAYEIQKQRKLAHAEGEAVGVAGALAMVAGAITTDADRAKDGAGDLERLLRLLADLRVIAAPEVTDRDNVADKDATPADKSGPRQLAEDLKAEVLEARTAGAAKFHVALDTAIDRFCEEHLGATWERELKQIVARAWLAVFDEPVDAVTPDATPVDGADHRRLMKDVRAALYFEITALDEYLEEGRLRQS